METSDLIQKLQNFAPQFLESYCIVNGAMMNLDEVQNMGWKEYGLRSKFNIPPKLYKYFPNRSIELIDEKSGKVKKMENYSIQALVNNTVFMQSPSLFDDVYDSDISLNYDEYEKIRLLEYCERCELNVCESMSTQEIRNALLKVIDKSVNSSGNFEFLFKRKPISKIEELSNDNFTLKLKFELRNGNDLSKALECIINADFMEYSQNLQNTFRATCFATTPYSQLMWGGSYADCHRGFCVEYTVLHNDPQYKDIFCNLFPMIYCKVRPNMTNRLARVQDKELTEEMVWDIYFHGALRKSIDWAFQNEWRLLLPMKRNQDKKDYCIQFFPITKVFLGSRMPIIARKEIIEICNDKNIPYIGVARNPNIFEMQECAIKCEKCPKYTEGIIR